MLFLLLFVLNSPGVYYTGHYSESYLHTLSTLLMKPLTGHPVPAVFPSPSLHAYPTRAHIVHVECGPGVRLGMHGTACVALSQLPYLLQFDYMSVPLHKNGFTQEESHMDRDSKTTSYLWDGPISGLHHLQAKPVFFI
jgi:hypothetical protein